MRWAMILRMLDMGLSRRGMTAGSCRAALGRTPRLRSGRLAGMPVPTLAVPVRRSTKSRTSCLVTRPLVPVPLSFARSDVVLAGEFADERGRTDVGRIVVTITGNSGCAGDGSGRRGRGFLLLRGQESGQRLLRGGGSGVAFTDYAYDSVDLNGAAFGDFDFLKDASGGAREFRRRPCRWKFRTGVRRAGLCRRAFSATW